MPHRGRTPGTGESPRGRLGGGLRHPQAKRPASRCPPAHDPVVAFEWHNSGMSRVRVSTTVDEGLLEDARRLRSKLTNAALLDEALEALLARHRSAEVDASYAAYDEHPLDEPDEWGDLASFREAAAAS